MNVAIGMTNNITINLTIKQVHKNADQLFVIFTLTGYN